MSSLLVSLPSIVRSGTRCYIHEVVRRGAGKIGRKYSSANAESNGPVFRPRFLPDLPSLSDALFSVVVQPHVSLAVRKCS